MPYVEYSRPMIQYTCSLDINSAFTNLPIAMAMTSSDTWHSIRHRLFPIGGPLEVSLYIGFWRYWTLSILQYRSWEKIFYFQRGPQPKKVTEGPRWLRYASDSMLHVVQYCQELEIGSLSMIIVLYHMRCVGSETCRIGPFCFQSG